MRNDCTACRLSECRTQMVEPDGATDSILAVGEAPGADEDERGVGFIGSAGRTLEREIEAITGLPREGWARTNIVRCRPPNNRKPFADEVRACTERLEEAIERQNPRVILAVGESAGRVLCGVRLRSGAYLPQVAGMIAEAQQRGSQALPLYEGRRVIPMPHTSGLAWNRTYRTTEGNRRIAELGRDAIRLAAQCFPIKAPNQETVK
ncbi:uracil-DNA glycosylase [Thioalkalivibrio sp. ALgr3]|uniref:uracil-DNA glycosylase n=1 Tax=Thioalkalivibrio sp. ALgr3 TaxID=1239292 RepID=UPI0003820408|nr:uracil-DNA glycosylase [Thioalkalivibrio sp. ALgr3]